MQNVIATDVGRVVALSTGKENQREDPPKKPLVDRGDGGL